MYQITIGEEVRTTDSLAQAREVMHVLAGIDIAVKIEVHCEIHGWQPLSGMNCSACQIERELHDRKYRELKFACMTL